ncbi:ABC transporter substrate-binding protein [Ureibacillus massiliensis 4400831 = CIP 108448 = CCUG 49529]|uniref:ABC transporter substrate-binding protein n=1 Tax=Ureibacillus massiliensis 4400831 = CIP 108448 = CCUG 49529 TaxID=1211035 RepID=A0A0A3JXA1_9BACL|nr:BMP family ABC transporter substrate-binding protein [Ureibacillus massiliensis]KGR91642.1 ABC transporter substrate-binding protein [Ureibacillus massiliensis 4400831 = CIP 108448 = CCUG 49529]
MKENKLLFLFTLCALILSACSTSDSTLGNERLKVGIMLSDAGLGDQSFSDLGFAGLEKARDELNISFDYRELEESGTYEQGIEELVLQGNDLIIGLGFSIQEALEKVAKKYPDTSFLLIDSQSELSNVNNITFKEDEGSFLIGVLAGLKTETNTVGFVGGEDAPIIHKFEQGFIKGVKAVNPEAQIMTEYAGTFGDDKLGGNIAKEMIVNGADFIYPAAGFTGVGVLLETQRSGVYSFGVDSDQFYLAEKSVVSSMVKQVDIAIYDTVKELVETGSIAEKNKVLGLKENGVALAPIRVIQLTEEEQSILEQQKQKISNGNISITE